MARTPRRRIIVLVVVVSLVGLVGLFAAVGLLSGGAIGGGSASLAPADRTSYPGNEVAGVAPESKAADSVAGGAAPLAEGTMQSDVALAVPPASTYSAHRLIRTGDLSLLVAKGTLLSTVDRVTSMTTASGGYVLSSSVGSDSGTPVPLTEGSGDVAPAEGLPAATTYPGSAPYATLTVRVPESLFDATLKRFGQLGRVESVSTSSEDVTSQFVDLQARLRHQRAVETRLVGFLSQTDSISETLAVQDRIDKVQLEIEQLSAQMKSLRETTSYGTLSVFLHEKGSAPIVAATPGFWDTLTGSLELLGRGARVTGLVLTALLPFVLVFGGIGLAVWFGVRRVRRSRRRTAQPGAAA